MDEIYRELKAAMGERVTQRMAEKLSFFPLLKSIYVTTKAKECHQFHSNERPEIIGNFDINFR